MRIKFLIQGSPWLFTLLFLTFSTLAQAAEDKVLTIHYQLKCDDKSTVAIPGYVAATGKQIRFLLPVSHTTQDIFVSGETNAETIVTEAERFHCSFLKRELSFQPVSDYLSSKKNADPYLAMALKHSPFIVVRSDQIQDDMDDVPLAVGYNADETIAENGDKLLTLKYTVFFSDEDKGASPEEQMTRYGRHSDVEWSYQIAFKDISTNPKLSVWSSRKEEFQCGWIAAIGDAHCDFDGKYMNGTHPILYNDSRIRHNVFTASGHTTPAAFKVREEYWDSLEGANQAWVKKFGAAKKEELFLGHHLIPETRFQQPEAREWLELRSDWISDFCAAETRAQNQICHRPEDYLYIVYRGKLHGQFRWVWNYPNDGGWTISEGEGSVDRLGEDLYDQEGISALYVPKAELDAYLGGRSKNAFLAVHDLSLTFLRMQAEQIDFYVREREKDGKLVLKNVSDRFRCESLPYPLNAKVNCHFPSVNLQ